MNHDFALLGDQLEAAAGRQISAATTRRRHVFAPIVALAGLAAVSGSALAAGIIDLPEPIDLPSGPHYHAGQLITLPDGRRCAVDLKTPVDTHGVRLAGHRCYLLPVPPNKASRQDQLDRRGR